MDKISAQEVLERSYQQVGGNQYVTNILSDAPTSDLIAPKTAKQKEQALEMIDLWVKGDPSDAKRSGSTEQTNFWIRLDRQGEIPGDGIRLTNFQVQVGGSSLAQLIVQKGMVGFEKDSEKVAIQKGLTHSLNRQARIWLRQVPADDIAFQKRGWFVPK